MKVAIVGCGLIGTEWDAASPAQAFSLTHAAGFSRQPGARLVALCDSNLEKARNAARRWGADGAYADPHAMFAAGPIDVVVVAASSAARWDVVAPALAAGVKVLVIEKPLATTLSESRTLAAAVSASGVRSVVNFSRHWDPSMRALRERIVSGDMGAIQRLTGTYGKGLTNNGSHMIDLAGFVCNARPVRARSLGSPLPESESLWSGGKDRALDAQIVYADDSGREYHLTMLGTDQSTFTCFELRVIGSKGIYDMSRGGRRLLYTPLQDDPNYAGYTVPGEAQVLPARAMEAMDLMAAEALQLARGEIAQASCDVQCALLTALTVEAVKQSDGAWIDINAHTLGE